MLLVHLLISRFKLEIQVFQLNSILNKKNHLSLKEISKIYEQNFYFKKDILLISLKYVTFIFTFKILFYVNIFQIENKEKVLLQIVMRPHLQRKDISRVPK